MIRAEFKAVAEQAIEELTRVAEKGIGQTLPRRYCLRFIGQKEPLSPCDAAEILTVHGYIDESHIWPCWDLFLANQLPDGSLQLLALRAGYPPCPYGEHWHYRVPGHDAGHIGPFKLGCHSFVTEYRRKHPLKSLFRWFRRAR